MRRWLIACAVALVAEMPAMGAEVWQWSVDVKGGRMAAGPAHAFLWVPSTCEKVKAVVLAQNNMEELSILENGKFREALAAMDMAEVWVAPSFDHQFRFNEGAGETFEGMMAGLAEASGYSEIRTAPVAPMGHSAAASWPYYLAVWKPNRVLAALSVSGQWPYFRDGKFAPDIWGDRTVDYVPCLESMGEYEAAATFSNEGLKERREHPLMPLSMLANPGQGHFATTEAKCAYLALYLKKAMEYRWSAEVGVDGYSVLKKIDPTKTGWLVDKWRGDAPPIAQAAPLGAYKGDAGQAFWYFDEELAKATEAYEAQHRGKRPQLVGFVQEGKMVPQTDTHLQVRLKFLPEEDGVTFKVGATFYEKVPEGSPRLPVWTGLPVGSPLGHAAGGEIAIEKIIGPFEKVGPREFRICFEKTGIGPGAGPNGPATNSTIELDFSAVHPGDGQYKPAVQQAQMFIPVRNKAGKEQHLAFEAMRDQRVGTKSITLAGRSAAGMPVSFYVREGPAMVRGNELTFTPMPPRAKFPVKVTVVAWQYGRGGEDGVQTAEPVERTFYLVR